MATPARTATAERRLLVTFTTCVVVHPEDRISPEDQPPYRPVSMRPAPELNGGGLYGDGQEPTASA